jgi:hypothetical protein
MAFLTVIHETHLQFQNAVRNVPVIFIEWLSDEADLLSSVNKTYHAKVNMEGSFISSGETPVPW